ncbi:MBL fold metallo-hydrolase [Geothrix edaphica]|uniref:MBL fold metallo-hydrolase n=1 Tax=Geothrix edaphica TaxID=2927976 RepID=A0ABQ5PYK1_9BACT|nr:MBL fold metallo-hydrolase [Geothrix edaphica]GLH67249.1 MBL fold metallo-hydrolase [Geothrix edaphica]
MRALLLATTLLLPGTAMTPSVPTIAARLEPLRLGQLQVWKLQDGRLSLAASLLKGLDAAEARRLLGDRDAADTPVNAYLVRMPGHTVLVDTGTGKDPEEDSGHLTEQLAAAGVAPSDVDLILITHEHFDHIGGLLKADGTRAFPRAVLRVARREHAFWTEDPSRLPERLRDRAPKLKALFEVYGKAGAFRPFEDGEELALGLRALPAHGHTGGHTVYAFTSGGHELWCIGDLIHFGAVQFQRPEVGVAFDLDGDRAVKVRQDLFREAVHRKVVLAGAHLPQIVRIAPKGAGYEAVPVR